MNSEDTKTKILCSAQQLFAEKGYEGASIREIAGQADVNIAAINYHFKNKENLYWSVFEFSHNWLSSEIEKLSKQHNNLFDLTWGLFNFLHDHAKFLRSGFMIMLSDSFPEMDQETKERLYVDDQVGPPGGEFLYAAVSKEVGNEVSEDLRHWAVTTLFADVIHWALIMSGSHCQAVHSDHPQFQMDHRKKSIEHLVKSTISYIKN